MIRMEDAIRAATRRFGGDARLQEEIARELRAHLEDSFEAARAEGLDEAEAEEAAVRAFGDPEEVGEKLLEANRRRMLWRMGRRAGSQVAVLLALIAAAFPLADWVWFQFLPTSDNFGPGLLVLFVVGLIYAISRWFLPKSAFIDLTYLRWLPAAFQRCVGYILHEPWVWATVLAATLLTAGNQALLNWVRLDRSGAHGYTLPTLFASWHVRFGDLFGAQPRDPFGTMAGFLAIAYLLFAARVPALLQSKVGISRRRALCWNAAFIVGAIFSVVAAGWDVFRQLFAQQLINDHGWYAQLWVAAGYAVTLQLLFVALLQAVFFVMAARLVRGATVSPREIIQPAYRRIGTLLGILAIYPFSFEVLWLGLNLAFNFRNHWEVAQGFMQCFQLVGFPASVLPVIVVSDSCRLGEAFLRFGTFVWRYFWRNVAFGVLSSVVVVAPGLLLRATFGNKAVNAATYAGCDFIIVALWWTLGAVLTVLWFEFYRTKAGTAEPTEGEAAPEKKNA